MPRKQRRKDSLTRITNDSFEAKADASRDDATVTEKSREALILAAQAILKQADNLA